MRRSIPVLLVLAAVAAGSYLYRRATALPVPGSDPYEQITRAFYHGVAALEVGLLDDARTQFTRATEIVPGEPAAWANLALSQVRLGELDAAAAPLERALSLAPDEPNVVLLAGRIAAARGLLDEAITHLRRAAMLETTGLRARLALAEELERAGNAENEQEALTVLDEALAREPSNMSVLVDRARIAARRGDFARLRDALERLAPRAATWPPIAATQFDDLRRAAAAGSSDEAQRSSNMLRNVLARVPEFLESLAQVRTPAELIAEPFDRFLALASPPATPSPPDPMLSYAAEDLAGSGTVPAAVVTVPVGEAGAPVVFAADATTLRRIGAPEQTWPTPGDMSPRSLVALDWNHDFLTDIVMAGSLGVRLLIQGADGSFKDATPSTPGVPEARCNCVAAWAADVEMDGDLDIIAGVADGDPVVLRNNGDGNWAGRQPFTGVAGARGFAWADLDADADPDAVFLDKTGRLHLFANRQAGAFSRLPLADTADGVAMTVADLDADGAFDVATLGVGGTVTRWSRGPGARSPAAAWEPATVATWPGLNAAAAAARLIVADLDNNGALDLVAAAGGQTRLWLADAEHRLQALPTAPAAEVHEVLDLTGDGRLDLLGVAGTPPAAPQTAPPSEPRPSSGIVRLTGQGARAYHWKVVRPRAQQNAGDQRINSFGVGGEIGVRSGLLVQKHVVSGPVVHVGLGTRTRIDVARIVWPNGVPQAEFGAAVDDRVVAEQRLKGSCPWVFAWNGDRVNFVTDFLWRSPLGLRINAQDTAGVVQTEDWVRIGGDQLVARDGAYDIRITAELWETHFFDHVSLLAVDHPADTEIYVDERFSAASPPGYAVHALRGVTAVTGAWDQRGRALTDLVARRDGRYAAAFERGPYQGIAGDHYVELDLGAAPADTLLAHGWIYPTDSSINVAIGQRGDIRPSGVSLEAQQGDGSWFVAAPDLGFPAGKHKTMVIDLRAALGARRVRLRTNLEISWDWLAVARADGAAPRTVRLPASQAELRYRGFSVTASPRGDGPETPDYHRLASTSPRWRDLIGYHTRFGDVLELLASVDDRYVIMNAGDELRLRFREPPAAPATWRRDFVLIGDGWEKDGDYNTGFSQTVLPLPSHDRPAYGAAPSTLELEDDPVYRRHRQDWERYHTRFVTPRAFVRGLWSSGQWAMGRRQ